MFHCFCFHILSYMQIKLLSSASNNCNIIASEYFTSSFVKLQQIRWSAFQDVWLHIKGRQLRLLISQRYRTGGIQKHQYIDKATHQNLWKKKISKISKSIEKELYPWTERNVIIKLIITKQVTVCWRIIMISSIALQSQPPKCKKKGIAILVSKYYRWWKNVIHATFINYMIFV